MISFKNVSYKIKDKLILSNITFNIKRGEKVLLMGSSGSGKTTLFNLLLKNIDITSGTITYEKKDIDKFTNNDLIQYRKNEIILILQKDDLFDNLSVYDNLALFYYPSSVINLLTKANLINLKDRIVSSLSGGERQRISIIKACLSNGNVLLCDEITSALDEDNAKKIIDFIINLFKDKTIIFICHNKELLIDKIDHYLYLENKTIKENITYKDVNNLKYKNKLVKTKSLFNVAILQGIKKIRLSLFILIVLSTICFYMSLYYKDIFSYIAKSSYLNYINYDVLLIKDNIDIKKDISSNLYPSFDDVLNNSKVIINNITIYNFVFIPFVSKDENVLVVNTLLTNKYNIDYIESISIASDDISFITNKVTIIDEDNMFISPSIYYDIKYFNDNYGIEEVKDIYIIDYDFTILDNRFTTNPLYIEKKEDKPYLENNAYLDYLTYKMVFDYVYDIVNYFFTISLLFIIIISILINVSIITKDKKQLAIYISKGYKDSQILLVYFIPLTLYFLLICLILFIHSKLIIPIIYSFVISIFSILISYYSLKKKSLHELLKSEYLS